MATALSVNQQELADWLDLSTRRIRELTTTGVLTKGPRGYDVRASVKAYLAFLRSTPADLKAERLRLATVKANLLELEYQQRKGELVSLDLVKNVFTTETHAMKDRLYNIPDRCSGPLASDTCPQETVYQILRGEITLALEEITSHAYQNTTQDERAQA